MRHIVMMKLQPGVFDDKALADYRATFRALREALPEDVLAVRVIPNAVPREQNMDVMIEMELRDADSLPRYLRHPLHVGIGERWNPYVVKIASFDEAEEKEGEP